MVLFDNTTTCSCLSRSHTCSTMATPTVGDAPSIFRDGKLKPGIYKIQSLYFKTYLDINEDSREVCGRPATDLEEGSGLVRPVQQSLVYVSDD